MKKNYFKIALAGIILLFGITSCSSDDSNSSGETTTNTHALVVELVSSTNVSSKYIKNGVATVLVGPSINYATAIDVENNNVYISGYSQSSSTTPNNAKIWKNGVPTNLTDGTFNAFAFDIEVVGLDVYVVGSERNSSVIDVACIWKNGVKFPLTNGTRNAAAKKVFVSGTDVYVCGYEKNTSNKFVAKIWKNGAPTSLTTGSTDAIANDVFVSGSDVYVCGFETVGSENTGRIWKNGVLINPGNTESNSITSIYVNGTDIYATGVKYSFTGNQAVIITNSTTQNISNGNYSDVNSILFKNNTLYYCGFERNTTNWNIAKVWKNGVPTELSSTGINAYAQGIFIE